MTLTDLLVPTYRQMLQMLRGLLEKAQQQLPDQAESLLTARLADDMLPLAAQVRFAAFQAQEAIFRLRGQRIPEWLDAIAAEGRHAGDSPGTIADATARLDDALSMLAEVSAEALDGAADLAISIALPGGLTFDMTGVRYARDWALPQFYFHVVTAYAILRHQDVAIGKAEYVPYMFAYRRPDAAVAG
ncbi:DUF1993 domain-containing protein [Sphingomonas sp. 8AM]|uniref:DUF1993 domain-containing protein n=1 Tax=Sphingomonas sp. 8AM TaxID=2653170 RepID=UPI0012EFDAFB|nr:DUF1993 domain-containing protein [Sphingomonas sp. 8AM]VXD03902.1 conserved hypothetical protein [Sphingomonas sp. 8AM]